MEKFREKVWECGLEILFRILKDYRKFFKKKFFLQLNPIWIEIIFLIIFLVWEARRKSRGDGEGCYGNVTWNVARMYQSECVNVVEMLLKCAREW